MKPREKEFCRLMTVFADPLRAAKEAGYKHPEQELSRLLGREEIAGEIRRRMKNIRSIYQSTAICGLYRLAYGGIADALTLLYGDGLTREQLDALDLMCVSEIKRTDKGVEVRFCDRIKAIDKLHELLGTEQAQSGSGSLTDAMLLSAQALMNRNGADTDGV